MNHPVKEVTEPHFQNFIFYFGGSQPSQGASMDHRLRIPIMLMFQFYISIFHILMNENVTISSRYSKISKLSQIKIYFTRRSLRKHLILICLLRHTGRSFANMLGMFFWLHVRIRRSVLLFLTIFLLTSIAIIIS